MRTRRSQFLALLFTTLAACGGESAPQDVVPQDAASTAMAVTLVEVQRERLEREVVASGQVTAWEDMPLGVELSGVRVAEVLVDVGAKVQRGDVLLRLDDRVLRSEAAQTQAALGEAQASAQLAKANLERGAALREKKLASAADYEQLVAAKAQADARVASARAALDAATLRLEFATLRAPDDGVISRRLTQPGAVVSAGSELFGLIRQNRLEWRADIAAADLPFVAPGQGARLRSPDGTIVEGRVRAVAPGLDPATRTARLQADLPEPGALHAGLVVEGRISLGSGEALTVPGNAVVRRDGYAYAFSVDAAGLTKRHRIELGRNIGDRIEVISGLSEGDRIVGRGAAFLGEGDRVRVLKSANDQ